MDSINHNELYKKAKELSVNISREDVFKEVLEFTQTLQMLNDPNIDFIVANIYHDLPCKIYELPTAEARSKGFWQIIEAIEANPDFWERNELFDPPKIGEILFDFDPNAPAQNDLVRHYGIDDVLFQLGRNVMMNADYESGQSMTAEAENQIDAAFQKMLGMIKKLDREQQDWPYAGLLAGVSNYIAPDNEEEPKEAGDRAYKADNKWIEEMISLVDGRQPEHPDNVVKASPPATGPA